jgi:transcriptional regulator with XRE-family HTH domain
MDLGTDLRNARELTGLSLSDLATRTRIPQRTLRAIEENDFSNIPQGIFARSFIRTYAREVGVDPDEAVAQYRSMTEPVVEPSDEPEHEVVDQRIRWRSFAPDFFEFGQRWGYALIAVALLIGFIGVNRNASRDEQPEAVAAAPAPRVEPPVDSATPVATTGGGVQVEMRAQDLCWVRAVVDGQLAFARLMQPGEMETLSGQRDVTLRVGDPAALAYSINGRSGQPLGAAKRAVTVRFDTSGQATRVS